MGCDDEVVSEEEIRQAISNERVESRIYVEGSRVYLSYERMCEVKSAKRIVSMILQEGLQRSTIWTAKSTMRRGPCIKDWLLRNVML